MKATQLNEHSSSVEVVRPFIKGCADNECYGGAGIYFLGANFPAKKICHDLGLGEFIRGSKKTAERKVSLVYNAITYHLLERSGPPGQPEAEVEEVIESVECSKI